MTLFKKKEKKSIILNVKYFFKIYNILIFTAKIKQHLDLLGALKKTVIFSNQFIKKKNKIHVCS